MKSCNKCIICKIASLLVVLGAINWGLYGIWGIDLVAKAAGVETTAAKVVYGLIGVSGILKLLSCFLKCPGCKTDSGSSETGCCAK